MEHLIIITRFAGELDGFWGYSVHESEATFASDNRKVWLLKQSRFTEFVNYHTVISPKLQNENVEKLGVIFHNLNSDMEAATLRSNLETAFNGKLAFCEWYSSNKTDFWNETDANAELPYNNLKKAWKDNTGDKVKTFEALWDYFAYNPNNIFIEGMQSILNYRTDNEESIDQRLTNNIEADLLSKVKSVVGAGVSPLHVPEGSISDLNKLRYDFYKTITSK